MRIVVTGGPSVGKTTIRGYKVVKEVATQLIKEGKFAPWIDLHKFQMEILRQQLNIESSLLEFDKITFLDRGAFDGEAYYIADGRQVPQAFYSIDQSQYDMAFLVEPLPFFDTNEVRREDLEFTKKISPLIESCYTSRKIKVVHVPALNPDERVDFILDEVNKYRNSRVVSAEQAAAMFRMASPVVSSFS